MSTVPLIIAAPGHASRGSCSRSVGLIDLYPTLLDLCGLPANEMNEGRSLVPLLEDPAAEWNSATITTYGPGNHAIQTDRYRYYQYEDGSVELYDHKNDPNEWRNVATDPEMRSTIVKIKGMLPTTNAESSKYNSYPTNQYFLDRYGDKNR